MASLFPSLAQHSAYKDRSFPGSQQDYINQISRSSTLYIGNLSFFTTEEQLLQVFSLCGEVKRVIMGLDRLKRTPCGFAFVEYYTASCAKDAMKYLNEVKCDDRPIRVDLDPGFREGRQFGRGKHGGQVRDEMRQDYDEGRGGYGARTRGQQYDTTDVPVANDSAGVAVAGESEVPTGLEPIIGLKKKRGFDEEESSRNRARARVDDEGDAEMQG